MQGANDRFKVPRWLIEEGIDALIELAGEKDGHYAWPIDRINRLLVAAEQLRGIVGPTPPPTEEEAREGRLALGKHWAEIYDRHPDFTEDVDGIIGQAVAEYRASLTEMGDER
jgi:hypothetical protein